MDPVRILRETSLFQDLDAVQLRNLIPSVRGHEFVRGGHVWDEGDPAVALFILASGQIKTFRISRAGGQIITQVVVPGEAFGHPGLFLRDGRRGTNAEALEPSVCLSIARDPLLSFLERNPPAMRRMLEALAHICWHLTEVLTDATFEDIRGRVARMLLELADSHGEKTLDGVRIGMKLSQGTLAGLIGASRENVNRALAYFITHGHVRHDDRFFTILRATELREEI